MSPFKVDPKVIRFDSAEMSVVFPQPVTPNTHVHCTNWILPTHRLPPQQLKRSSSALILFPSHHLPEGPMMAVTLPALNPPVTSLKAVLGPGTSTVNLVKQARQRYRIQTHVHIPQLPRSTTRNRQNPSRTTGWRVYALVPPHLSKWRLMSLATAGGAGIGRPPRRREAAPPPLTHEDMELVEWHTWGGSLKLGG